MDILFSKTKKPHLEEFFQIISDVKGAPHFYVNHENELTYQGEGNFGLLVYRKPVLDFDLYVKFRTPKDGTRTNSGIYLRMKDVSQPLENYPDEIREKIRQDLNKWAEGKLSTGPGIPAVHSGYEVQLERGFTEDPNSKRNGALYDTPIGKDPGSQQAARFDLIADETYETFVSVRGSNYLVRMKREAHAAYQITSIFENTNSFRGNGIGYIALQAYATSTELRPITFIEVKCQVFS